MIRFHRIFAPLILAFLPLGLLGCETLVHVETFPDLTFAHLKPIKLNVAKFEVVSQYQASLRPPNVEHLFPTPPVKALKQWAKDRFRTVGRSGTARLVILNATAIEVQLQRKTGLTATFTKQQSQRYDMTVQARLEVTNGEASGHTIAQATRFSTIREDASINKRERLWFELTDALVRDFDKVMEENIRKHLAAWLR